jgi:hypothetical protein
MKSPGRLDCEQVEELLPLRVFNGKSSAEELTVEEAKALDAHLASCEDCRRELAALRGLRETLLLAPPAEPSAQLLEASRQRLAAAIYAEKRSGKVVRILATQFSMQRLTPLAAAAMLLAGVGVGGFSGYQLGVKAHGTAAATTISLMPQANAPIASVNSVTPQPGGSGVVVSFNRMMPESATGSMDDPAIRQLLAMGIQSPTDPQVQDDSVRLLAEACSHGPQCDDGRVRSALMTAALYDGDPALREKALAGLAPFLTEDTRVRDAVLESVMHDNSPEVRAQAIHMLSPVEADSSVRQVLHNVSTTDQDPLIRRMSRSMDQTANDVGLQIQ